MRVDLGLAGRVVIVTGATSGIGLEVSETFAAEGARLILTYNERRDPAEELAETLRDRHGVQAVVVDYSLGDLQSAQNVVRTAMTEFGRVDVLVNNAVRFSERARSGELFESVSEDQWRYGFRANAEGAIHLSRLVAPALRGQGWGRLVHMGSTVATMGMAGNEYYAASKAALVGFSRSLAFSLGSAGDILSNVVEPGFTRTSRNEGEGIRMEKAISELVPIKRLVTGDEVARVVVFLCSEANTGMSGQVISVAGGQ